MDALVNVDAHRPDADAAALRLGLSCVDLEYINRSGPGQFSCHPAAVAKPSPPAPWVYADASLDLWAVAAAGAFTPEGIAEDPHLNTSLVPTCFQDQVARNQISRTTAIERTAAQFVETWQAPPTWSHAAIIWICDRRSLRDCVMFWNYRALRPLRFFPFPMILLPEHEVDRMNLGAQVMELFQSRPDDFSPDALFCSNRVSHERLCEIADSWGMVESSEQPRSGYHNPPSPPRTPPFTYRVDLDPRAILTVERDYGAKTPVVSQVFSAQTEVAFDSPVQFYGPGRVKVRLMSEVFDPYPKRPSVADLFEGNGAWHDGGYELLTHALPRYQLTLRIPPLDDAVNAVLGESVASWSLSDKGLIGESITAQGGSPDLLTPGLYETVRSLTTRRAKALLQELKASRVTDHDIDLEKFAADIGGRIERRSQSALQVEGVDKECRSHLLERLVALSWADRGLRIVCRQCGVTSFVLLGDVTSDARCPGCRRTENYEQTKTGPTIFYRLNALIDRASDQGVLPHLLAIAVLQRHDGQSRVLPGVDLEFSEGTRSEVDLFGVFEGRVIAGEVKTNGNDFGREQLMRDFALTKRLGADIHVMAWLGSLPEDSRERAHATAKRHGTELCLLPLEELRTKR